MDKALRNTLRNVVTQCRKLLEGAIGELLQGQFGVHADGRVEDTARLTHLSPDELRYREEVLAHLEHIKASGLKPKDASAQLIREAAFTHLNRLCAYKMMARRELIEDPVGKGLKSRGFIFYLGDHPVAEALYRGAKEEVAYRHYFDWINEGLSAEIGVLFAREDLATRLSPPYRILIRVLDLINTEELADIWTEDETIGWVYQYFTPKELRDQARKESAAPRNSYELAFRNQFYTPRYVVEFLVDNTLGRLWYEMRKGETVLTEKCRYLVRSPNELFLSPDEDPSENAEQATTDLSKGELHKQSVYIKHRKKKDPREIKILDPACGSGHFLLYCFGLLERIYEEAFEDVELGPRLQADYSNLNDLKREIPRLIVENNLHGIDIDLRSTQISALALWLRCQRAYKELELKNGARPQIRKTNIVCAEPMPGEHELIEEFAKQVYPPFLGEVVRVVFEKMELAGEAGSLLKIESEISGAIAEAKEHWRAVPQHQQLALFRKERLSEGKQGALFDLSGITDEEFWDEAEARVLESLREYSQSVTSNGQTLLRRLFADDAAQGFAFVDICRKRFDVVLMNPPFGSCSLPSKGYVDSIYTEWRYDLFPCFVSRGTELLSQSGMLGAITSRTGFFLSRMVNWRRKVLLGESRLEIIADLGYRVLDDALVEVAAYVIVRAPVRMLTAFNCLKDTADDKPEVLRKAILVLNNGGETVRESCLTPLAAYQHTPLNSILYWAPQRILDLFRILPTLDGNNTRVREGLHTADNERFVRAWWEVCPSEIQKKRYVPYAKGGDYAPFYSDIHLLLDWGSEGKEILEAEHGVVPSKDLYFKGGLTYTGRTASAFSVRPLPTGSIFSQSGAIIWNENKGELAAFLGLLMSSPSRAMIEYMVGSGDAADSGSAARHFLAGIIGRIPIPTLSGAQHEALISSALKCAAFARQIISISETDHNFIRLGDVAKGTSLRESFDGLVEYRRELVLDILDEAEKSEAIANRAYGIDQPSSLALKDEFGEFVTRYPEVKLSPEQVVSVANLSDEQLVDATYLLTRSRGISKQSFLADRRHELLCHYFKCHPKSIPKSLLHAPEEFKSYLQSLTAYCVGCAFGRWDVRYATGECPLPELSDPFNPLPVCAPGALTNEEGLPLNDAPEGYPLGLDSHGILVDDPTHADDIIARVREVSELIWPKAAEKREREAAESLSVKELRDYFRKPTAGGFWMDHIRRYSKSRRKAPIYWLLRSSKGNYALWLYYHRLDKDILYKALLNYVEPKLRLEKNNLSQLRQRRETVGTTGREAKQLEKELDKQESFISELHDFHDKLKRAADLHLEPDLNDGVVLNIAPLWELVPWKEAEKYWKEMLAGKYEWSSIGKQLRERGLVKL